MADPLSRAALDRAFALSRDIELQLIQHDRTAPVVALIAKARQAAAGAIVALAEVNPEDPGAIRTMQNNVRCFVLIMQWLREIVADGFDAATLLDMRDREELADELGITEDDASGVLETGLMPDQE